MAVVETETFLASATRLRVSEEERAALIIYLATNPEVGRVVPETGGLRKLRWAIPGRGKSGGARVIYYYHNERLPVFLLSAYAKNRKANLSEAERNAMKRLVPALVAVYPRKG